MTTTELIEYYQGLLIMQYSTMPKASAMIAAFVAEVVASQIILQTEQAFQITTTPGPQLGDAIGAQLDALATYRGAQRQYVGLDTRKSYMLMPFYGDSLADTDLGFADYGQTPITWFFITYGDANAPIYQLNDNELERLIQFRAVLQSMNMSLETVDDLLFAFFGDNVALFESALMKITYVDLISDPDTLFTICNQTQSLPKPAGVQITVIRSETVTEFFGFQFYGQANNPTFVGYGIYGTPQVGSFVRYG